jgi:transcription initiation factor IIF auxiliary subunit
VKRNAPYEVTRVGWGEFEVVAKVVLKHGWQWVHGDAQLEGRKSVLAVEWMLSFEGMGAEGSGRFKVRRERKARNRGERAVSTSVIP